MKIYLIFYLIIFLGSVYPNEVKNETDKINKILNESNLKSLKNYRLPSVDDIIGNWTDPFWTNYYREGDELNINLPPYILKTYLNEDKIIDYVILLINKSDEKYYAVYALLSSSKKYVVNFIEDHRRGRFHDMGFYRIESEKLKSYKVKNPVLNDWVRYVLFQTAELDIYIHRKTKKIYKSSMGEN